MAARRPDYSHFGFFKTYVVPAALIFLVPVLSFFFFRHARDTYDERARSQIMVDIANNSTMTAEQKEQAKEFFNKVPISRLINEPEIIGNMDEWVRFNYLTFAWMIFLSAVSIVGGIGVFLLAGVCILFSLYSQAAQYWSLMIGWQVLRFFGALQTVIMGVLIVALSFWVTALWGEVYYVKLMVIAGVVAVGGIGAVIWAIFANPKQDFTVHGIILDSALSIPFRDGLQSLCLKIGTDPPAQIIAGIDDNFFVTEQPVTVEGKTYRGKSLFVSLALLKQLNATEADSVLAHEMAHFSGNDTLYSKKISPLLSRFDIYLQRLREGFVTLPIFYYMLCFRALFEVSLGRLRRQRELRADAVAASVTSPRDFAAALLRITAYAKFRQQVENELFSNETALETADVSHRVETGFPAFATAFAANPDLGAAETSHPFDSHPPTAQRIAALGVNLRPDETQLLLGTVGDGRRRHDIPEADELERRQWQEYEELFRKAHQQSLAYRHLPSTDEEREVVKQTFPDLVFEGKDGRLAIDCDTLHMATWDDPLPWGVLTSLELKDNNLTVHFNRGGQRTRTIRMNKFSVKEQPAILAAIQNYYGRYLTAVAYRQQKEAEVAPT